MSKKIVRWVANPYTAADVVDDISHRINQATGTHHRIGFCSAKKQKNDWAWYGWPPKKVTITVEVS